MKIKLLNVIFSSTKWKINQDMKPVFYITLKNTITSTTKTKKIQSGNLDVLLKKGHIPVYVRRKRCCLLQKIKIPRAARETTMN